MHLKQLVLISVVFGACSAWLGDSRVLVSGQETAVEQAAPAEQEERNEPLDEQTRKQWAASAVMMLVGVLFLGVMLLVLVMRWGYVARKLARKPLPPTTRGDELWYLKPPKEQVEQPDSGESAEKPYQ